MIGTMATICAVFVTVGVIGGTVSGWRVGTPWREMWRSARAWYVTWIVLMALACLL